MMKKSKFAGADWVKESLGVPMSPLGEKAAEVLGRAFKGIYHLPEISLRKVDWGNKHFVSILYGGILATYDFNRLTELVVACHDLCVRCEIGSASPSRLRINFTSRAQEGWGVCNHPSLDMHVKAIRNAWYGEK